MYSVLISEIKPTIFQLASNAGAYKQTWCKMDTLVMLIKNNMIFKNISVSEKALDPDAYFMVYDN